MCHSLSDISDGFEPEKERDFFLFFGSRCAFIFNLVVTLQHPTHIGCNSIQIFFFVRQTFTARLAETLLLLFLWSEIVCAMECWVGRLLLSIRWYHESYKCAGPINKLSIELLYKCVINPRSRQFLLIDVMRRLSTFFLLWLRFFAYSSRFFFSRMDWKSETTNEATQKERERERREAKSPGTIKFQWLMR